MKKTHLMPIGTRSARLLLLFILVLAALAILPSAEADRQRAADHAWILTTEARLRTANGECNSTPATPICRELCLISNVNGTARPIGRFSCFAD